MILVMKFTVCLFILIIYSAGIRGDDTTTGAYKWPTVSISILARNKAHTLPYFLSLLTMLDYPKDRISLWIRSDHNQDDTFEVLKLWFAEVKDLYHNIDIEMIEEGLRKFPDESGPTDWPKSRFQHVIKLREHALNFARNSWADFLLMLDADVFFTEVSVLKDLVSKNLPVVAPMLKSDGLYSNFWCGMSKKYYYVRTEEYKPTLYRERLGCFNVPMVHSAVLINLRISASDRLTYNPSNLKNYDGPFDDIIAFAVSANKSDISLHVCNEKKYGYVMIPLQVKDTIEMDYQQLINIKIESISDNTEIRFDSIFEKFIHYPSRDTVGFDKIYMINLERRPDRRQRMELCFKELGLNVSAVHAVDGRELNDEIISRWGISFLPDYKDPYHNRPMTLGEIGCFLSHYNIWKEVKKNGYDKVMILEDDIRFEPYFRRKIEFIMDEIDESNVEWDLIYLGRKLMHETTEPHVTDSLVRAGYSYWTIGYLLSSRGASKLLDASPLVHLLPVDEYLPIMFDSHPESSWSSHFVKRNLVALSAAPLVIFPTHYTGEVGYISDTEDSVQVPDAVPEPSRAKEDL